MNIVYVPCKNKEEAQKIGRFLIRHKLSVCVNIIPEIYSIFRFEGKVDESAESVLIIKTIDKLVNKVIIYIKKFHSYEQPTIISWKIDKTTKEVEKWLIEELKQ